MDQIMHAVRPKYYPVNEILKPFLDSLRRILLFCKNLHIENIYCSLIMGFETKHLFIYFDPSRVSSVS